MSGVFSYEQEVRTVMGIQKVNQQCRLTLDNRYPRFMGG
jgi:hypothetical protein